jgi:hypothetical protein
MAKVKMPGSTAIVFNGAALLVVGASLAFVARSVFVPDDVTPCRDRYEAAMRFGLDRGGEPMAAADLQARLGNTDWGLLETTRVVKLKTGPGKHALEIDLAKVSPETTTASGEKRAGVGFTWTPPSLGKARAACLSYAVYLPEDFAFGKGGRLPGLMGGAAKAADDAEAAQSAISTRYTWSPAGAGNVLLQGAGNPEGRPVAGANEAFPLPRGKWVGLDQEVILNAPGQKNGVLRVWLDGKLVLNRTGVVYRTRPDVTLSGVLAETNAGEPPAGKPGARRIWMTPFELRWQ